MNVSARVICSWIVAAGLVLSSPSWAAGKKGPKISVGDDPSMKEGSPGLVLVEVSDFQCFFCAKGAREVLPLVYERFVATGKLELIYLDLPLQGPRAFKAAEAAACAGDQDMFWDMHHQLFANQQGLSPDRLATYAEEIGLDAAAFRKCLDSGRHAGGIREDMRAIKVLDINSTPAYLLGRRVPESDKVEILDVIRGAKPYEEFEKKINALLLPETSGKD